MNNEHITLAIYKNLYNNCSMKGLYFAGSSLDELKAFPVDAKREAGFQLDRVQKTLIRRTGSQ